MKEGGIMKRKIRFLIETLVKSSLILILIISCFVIPTYATENSKSSSNDNVSPRILVWQESANAHVSNYNRIVKYSTTADVFSTGAVDLKNESFYLSDLLRPAGSNGLDGWSTDKFGNGCFGSYFNAYDLMEMYDLIGAFLGNCYDTCACPFSPSVDAPRNCSCR